MTVPTAIDRAAPVIARHEIDIEAPLDGVWKLHVDVNAWPIWQTDITAAHINGALEPGASFDWTSYGFSVYVDCLRRDRARARVCGAQPPAGSPVCTSGSSTRRRTGERDYERVLRRRAGRAARQRMQTLARRVRWWPG